MENNKPVFRHSTTLKLLNINQVKNKIVKQIKIPLMASFIKVEIEKLEALQIQQGSIIKSLKTLKKNQFR